MATVLIGGVLVIILVHITFPFYQDFATAHIVPHLRKYIGKMRSMVKQAWAHATWYEKIGLVIFCFGWLIPGPLDELLGLLLIRRILKRARTGPKPEWMADHT